MLVSKSIPPHQRGGRNIPISIGMTSDSTSIILDPSVDGTGYSNNATNATWSVTFANNANGGTVSGIASCNSLSGTYATAYPEYNNQITQGETSGANCWCRMTSPVRSAWVFEELDDSVSKCSGLCAFRCARNAQEDDYITFRRAYYDSAGN